MVKAVKSVQIQDYQNLEIIILDDCSTDNTSIAATELVKDDTRIKYIRHKKNSGTGAGFNTGIKNANGKYIAFLDDDDLWRPHKTVDQVTKMERLGSNYGLITGGVDYFDLLSGNRIKKIFRPQDHDPVYKKILLDSISTIGPPSVVLLRLSSVRVFGPFREDMPRGCCQEYYRRFLKNYKMTSIQSVCTDYAEHEKKITKYFSFNDYRDALISYKIKLSGIELDLKKYPVEYSIELGKIGDIACLLGNLMEGRCFLRRALLVNPFRIKLWIAFILSIFGARIYRLIRLKYFRSS